MSHTEPAQRPLFDLSRMMSEKAQLASQFITERGYEVSQRNGQRITINPRVEQPKEKFCEIFFDKLPRDIFEDKLLPILEQVGDIYNIRLMMDFSGYNRGFGFCKYATPELAKRACESLNGFTIQDGQKIGVAISFDNNCLCFGNLPHNITEDRLLRELNKIIEGITKIELSDPVPDFPRQATIVFQSHEAATNARRVLLPNARGIKICGREPVVDWAQPDHGELPRISPKPQAKNPVPPSTLKLPLPTRTQQTSLYPHSSSSSSSSSPPIANSISFRSPTSFGVQPLLGNSILGETARQMLLDTSDFPSPEVYKQNVITVCNINPNVANLNQFKTIFQLGNNLKVTNIAYSTNPGSIVIAYANKSQADVMLETLTLFPKCFERLALPNQFVMAYRNDTTDINSNYQKSNRNILTSFSELSI